MESNSSGVNGRARRSGLSTAEAAPDSATTWLIRLTTSRPMTLPGPMRKRPAPVAVRHGSAVESRASPLRSSAPVTA